MNLSNFFWRAIWNNGALFAYIVKIKRVTYLNPSKPSSEPFTVSTGALAYAFATRRLRSKTITFAQISSSIWVHLSNTSCMWSCKTKDTELITPIYILIYIGEDKVQSRSSYLRRTFFHSGAFRRRNSFGPPKRGQLLRRWNYWCSMERRRHTSAKSSKRNGKQ